MPQRPWPNSAATPSPRSREVLYQHGHFRPSYSDQAEKCGPMLLPIYFIPKMIVIVLRQVPKHEQIELKPEELRIKIK